MASVFRDLSASLLLVAPGTTCRMADKRADRGEGLAYWGRGTVKRDEG